MKKILLYLFCFFFYSSLFSQEELPAEVLAPSPAEFTYFFYGISVGVSFICVSLLLRTLRRGLRVDSFAGID